MSLRDRPDRRFTPDDSVTNGEGPDPKPSTRGLSAGPAGMGTRGLRMVQNDRRVTPNDHGGIPEEPLITIRKLNDSDGSEVKHNGRGAEADLFDTDPGSSQPYTGLSCRALFANGSGFNTVGTACDKTRYGNVVRWSSGLARGRRSSDAGVFDAGTGWSGSSEPTANRFYAVESNDLLWIAGSVPNGSYHRRAIQALDPDTLAGQFIVEMSDILNNSGVEAHWWQEIAPTSAGILTHRAGALPNYTTGGTFTVTGGTIESFDASGTITNTLAWHNRTTGGGSPSIAAGIGTAVGVATNYKWIGDVALGRDGRAYFVALRNDDTALSDRDNFPRLITTDTSLALANSVQMDTGTYFPARGWLDTGGDVAGVAANSIWNYPFRILVDSTAVYVLTHSKTGVAQPASPNFGVPSGTTRSPVVFQFDLSGNLSSAYLIRGAASNPCLLDDAGNLFYTFSYAPAAPPSDRLVKLTGGIEQWETNAVIPINTTKCITTGGYHYFVGGASGQEVSKLDAATGALVWTGRHDEALLDVIKSGSHVYVCGDASEYAP